MVTRYSKPTYPNFLIFDPSKWPPDILKRTLDILTYFPYSKIGGPGKKNALAYYESIAVDGTDFATWQLAQHIRSEGHDTHSVMWWISYLQSRVNEIFLQRLHEDLGTQMPWWSRIVIRPFENAFAATYQELEREKIPNSGTAYSSPSKPTCIFNGEQYRVGLSQHALERIAERLCRPTAREHAKHAATFQMVMTAYMQSTQLPSGVPALSLYCHASPGTHVADYVNKVLINRPFDADVFVRMGYLPVVLTHGFAYAKTLLTPGFNDTPEKQILIDKYTLRGAKQILVDLSDNPTRDIDNADAMEVVRRLHEECVPQFVGIDDISLQEYSDATRTVLSTSDALLVEHMSRRLPTRSRWPASESVAL